MNNRLTTNEHGLLIIENENDAFNDRGHAMLEQNADGEWIAVPFCREKYFERLEARKKQKKAKKIAQIVKIFDDFKALNN